MLCDRQLVVAVVTLLLNLSGADHSLVYYETYSPPVYYDYYQPYKDDPNLRCPANAEWTECVSPCPWTCKRIKEFQLFADLVCPGFCRAGCNCKFGYVLTEDYRCVSVLTCFMW